MFLARLFETTALVTVFEMQDNFSLVKEKNVKDVLMFSFAYSTAFRQACQSDSEANCIVCILFCSSFH